MELAVALSFDEKIIDIWHHDPFMVLGLCDLDQCGFGQRIVEIETFSSGFAQ